MFSRGSIGKFGLTTVLDFGSLLSRIGRLKAIQLLDEELFFLRPPARSDENSRNPDTSPQTEGQHLAHTPFHILRYDNG